MRVFVRGLRRATPHAYGARTARARTAGRCACGTAAGGAALLTLEGHTNYVSAVACHSVGEGSAAWRVVSGSEDKTVRAWDGASRGAALLTLEGHTNYVSAVACHGALGRAVRRGAW